jgi:hypothetical protein
MLRSDSRRDTDTASNFDNSSRRSMIDTSLLFQEMWMVINQFRSPWQTPTMETDGDPGRGLARSQFKNLGTHPPRRLRSARIACSTRRSYMGPN